MAIYIGSKLRVDFTFVDHKEDGTEIPIPLDGVASKTAKIVRPDGSEITPAPTLTVSNAAAGKAYWQAEADVLNQSGGWRAQGFADGYKSDPVSWRVEPDPLAG